MELAYRSQISYFSLVACTGVPTPPYPSPSAGWGLPLVYQAV